MKILLVGNPNVGKSTFFSRLTGINVMISNYPGTTVEFKQGNMKIDGKRSIIIDVPGTYSLNSDSPAEKVAVSSIRKGDAIINVIDSTNLERNLFLTLQLLEKGIPMVVALNFWNETRHKGIRIDVEKLEQELGVPVIPTVAVTGEGVNRVVESLKDAKAHKGKTTDKQKWIRIGKIIKKVQRIKRKKHTLAERLEDLSIKPRTGIPLAVVVMFLMFFLLRYIGEGLINIIFTPIFTYYYPVVERLSSILGQGLIHDILIGSLIDGKIDYIQSMGLLTTGLFVPIGMILPYVFAFYLMLGILEDTGYLPRLATLVDNIMHRLGMHGCAIIPMLLGIGCNVPGTLASRILETRRQRFIVITLTAITIPCMAQIAMVYGLLMPYGIINIIIVMATLVTVWLVLGIILNKTMKGIVPETFMEITPYRMPHFPSLLKKLWMRLRSFLTEAIPYVFLGVLIMNILYATGIIQAVGDIASPVVVGILGLPKEAVASLIIGFLRKDVAVGMLVPLGLTIKQLIIACVILTMYFPCIATFVVIFKELGLKDTMKSAAIMVTTSLLTGGLLNLIL